MKRTALAALAAATAFTVGVADPGGSALAATSAATSAAHTTAAGHREHAYAALASASGLSAARAEAGYRDLVDALIAAGGTVDGDVVTYQLAGHGPIQLAVPGVTPSLGGGWDGWNGPYVSFNRTDQGALLAGGGAALAAAICLIPAVGQAACVVAAALVAIAVYYLDAYGKCPTSRPNLRVYVWGRSRGCYS